MTRGRPRIHPKVENRGRLFWSKNEGWFVRIYQGSTNPQHADKCVGMCNQTKIENRFAELEAAGIPYYAERYYGTAAGYRPFKTFEGRAN